MNILFTLYTKIKQMCLCTTDNKKQNFSFFNPHIAKLILYGLGTCYARNVTSFMTGIPHKFFCQTLFAGSSEAQARDSIRVLPAHHATSLAV